jgi:hypothetical protein
VSNSATRSGCSTVGSVHADGTHPLALLVFVISPG